MQLNAKKEGKSSYVSVSVRVMKFRAVYFSLWYKHMGFRRETAKHMAALNMKKKNIRQLISPIN